MIASSSRAKLAGYSLSLGMPLLAPLGVRLGLPWLAPALVFGLFPVLSVLIGEDRSLPVANLRRSPVLLAYLDILPRIYAAIWIGTLVWAVGYVGHEHLAIGAFAWLIVSVGIGSAVAICTAHELMHQRSRFDVALGRLMSAFCLYGHMYVEHMHHHATVGEVAAGQTAPRGMSIYRFAPHDFVHGLRNARTVERDRLQRTGRPLWQSLAVHGHVAGLGLAAVFFALGGVDALLLFVG